MIETNNMYSIPKDTPVLSTGSNWIKEKRTDLRLSFNNSPLPRRGLNLWRYTDPEKFLPMGKSNFNNVTKSESSSISDSLQSLSEGKLSGLVIDRGGREISINISKSDALNGLVVKTLSNALESDPDLVEKHLYQLIGSDGGKFEALNGALWQEGIFIYLPDNKKNNNPLHLIRESGHGDRNEYPRLLVVCGNNSELTIIDEYCSVRGENNEPSQTNSAVEIYCGEDSHLSYLSLQRQAESSHFYLTHRAKVAGGGHVVTIPLVFGAALSKQNFGVSLAGKGAHSDIYGLLFGVEHQQFDNHTLHHHASGNTTSKIDFKVVLNDRARSAYTGLIRIDNKAKGCEAYQENRNLVLSPKAKAESIPELEILNEDVSCSHGATVGPIDQSTVFYLKSRGIPEDVAIRMIVSGYVATTLKLVSEGLREKVELFVSERLAKI